MTGSLSIPNPHGAGLGGGNGDVQFFSVDDEESEVCASLPTANR